MGRRKIVQPDPRTALVGFDINSDEQDEAVYHHVDVKLEGGQIAYDRFGRLKDKDVARMFEIVREEVSKIGGNVTVGLFDVSSNSSPCDIESSPGSAFRTFSHEICFSLTDPRKVKAVPGTSEQLTKALKSIDDRREDVEQALNLAVRRIKRYLAACHGQGPNIIPRNTNLQKSLGQLPGRMMQDIISFETYEASRSVRLMNRGEKADTVYMIVDGKAHVVEEGLTLVPGQLVGEFARLEGGRRTASVDVGRGFKAKILPPDFVTKLLKIPPFGEKYIDFKIRNAKNAANNMPSL